MILVHNFYCLSSLQRALILLLLIIVSYGHVSLQYERTTDLLDTLLFVIVRFTGKEKRQEIDRRGGRKEREREREREEREGGSKQN